MSLFKNLFCALNVLPITLIFSLLEFTMPSVNWFRILVIEMTMIVYKVHSIFLGGGNVKIIKIIDGGSAGGHEGGHGGGHGGGYGGGHGGGYGGGGYDGGSSHAGDSYQIVPLPIDVGGNLLTTLLHLQVKDYLKLQYALELCCCCFIKIAF